MHDGGGGWNVSGLGGLLVAEQETVVILVQGIHMARFCENSRWGQLVVDCLFSEMEEEGLKLGLFDKK